MIMTQLSPFEAYFRADDVAHPAGPVPKSKPVPMARVPMRQSPINTKLVRLTFLALFVAQWASQYPDLNALQGMGYILASVIGLAAIGRALWKAA
jgi:hypothetical protein